MTRRLLMIAALVSLAGSAWAGENLAPPAYAIVSLIGDKVALVGYQPATGTRLNANRETFVSIADGSFDATALRSIQESAPPLAGQPATTLLYRLTSSRLSANPALLFDGDKALLPPAYADAMKNDGATRVLLVTRRRSEAVIQALNQAVGGGRIEGVGYYADTQQAMEDADTHYSSVGYIAPYVSLQLSLIDLASATVLARQSIYETRIVAASNGEQDHGDPWRLLNDAEKIELLNSLIEKGVKKAMPLLLNGQ